MINKIRPKTELSRSSATLIAGSTIAQAVPIAVSPILTRLYRPEDFGVFALFVAMVAIFSVVAMGRYEMAILLPEKDEDAMNLFALAGSILLVFSLFLLVLITLFEDRIVMLMATFGSIGHWLFWVPISILLIGFFNLLSVYNNRQKHYSVMAQANVIKSLVLAIGQVGIGFVKGGAAGLIYGQIFSGLFANFRLLKNIMAEKKLLMSISAPQMKKLAAEYASFPKFQVPHVFLNTFSTQMPVYLFSFFFSAATVGLFSLSTRIVFTPMMIVSSSAARVFNEQAAKLHNEKSDLYAFSMSLLRRMAIRAFFPFAAVVFFAPDLFALLFGDAWREAGVFTQILSPWLFMVFIVSLIAFIPNIYGRQKKALLIEMVYSGLRLVSLVSGILLDNIYLALALFSASGFVMLSYNLVWMLGLTKGKY